MTAANDPRTRREAVPILEEELQVGTRRRTRSRVRIRKTVLTRKENLVIPLEQEVVDIHRVPKNQPVLSPPPIRRENETLVIPVVEEVPRIEKQLILREELHITKRRFVRSRRLSVPVRREDVRVDRD